MEELYLAALLHDIGKFYQRTNIKEDKRKINEIYREIYESEGAKGARHQEWGAYFLEGLKGIDENTRFKVAQLIRNHHNPSTLEEMLIAVADRLSSGERDEKGENEEESKNLISVLSIVDIMGQKGENRHFNRYKPLTRLSDYSYPLEKEEANIEERYRSLWEKFCKVIREEDDAERIYYILREYTSNIPAAYYYSRPDISLFSHLKTTAAIAVCLYRQFEEDIKKGRYEKINDLYTALSKMRKGQKLEGDDRLFCLIKGDISGIQNFLYSIDMDGAVRNLKARSFYIAYILEIIANYIIKNEGLTISNLLYCGGGHFYILAPAKTMERLNIYQQKIDEVFWQAHELDLAVILAASDFSWQRLYAVDFSPVFTEVGQKLEEAKKRKYYSVLQEEVFAPVKRFKVCPYCGREIGEKCEFCASFIEIGNNLFRQKYVIFSEQEAYRGPISSVNDVFRAFGCELVFSSRPHKKGWAINREDVDLSKVAGYLKTANYVWKESDKVVEISQVAEAAQGIKRWGVLRGDMDNLGEIFARGLGDNKSISRTSTLSMELEMFFGKFMEDMVRKDFNRCSVIYAGGDDFFIIGPWSDLPGLAERIREELANYSGNNTCLSISMAIEIAPDVKYPIYRVAQEAGDSLDMAKEYIRNNSRKNALVIFKTPVGWEEFAEYKEIKDILFKLIQAKVSRSLFNVIYSVNEQYEKSQAEGDIFKSWRLVYYIARLKERNRGAKNEFDDFMGKVLKSNNKLYPKLSSAAWWADLETRV